MNDPFQIARNKFQSQTASAPMIDVAGNGVFNPQEQNPAKQDKNNLANLLTKTSGPDQMNQDIMNAVQKLDISNTDLPMSPIGKHILSNRLKDRWGDEYSSKPEIKQLMNMFDSFISSYQDEATRNNNKAISSGDRTLAALMGEM